MHDDELNKDPVWKLLENASETKADPLFSRNVMRQIRLEASAHTPWWSQLLRPTPIIGTVASAAACCALLFTFQTTAPLTPSPPPISHSIEACFDELSHSLEADADLDDLMYPISLIATHETEWNEFDTF